MNRIMYSELSPCKFVGIPFEQKLGGKNIVPESWVKLEQDGTIKMLRQLENPIFPNALLGMMYDYNHSTKYFTYCIGVLVKNGPFANIKSECELIDIPKCLLAIGTIESGPKGASNKNKKMYEKNGYELDYKKGFEIEYYEGVKGNGIFKYITPVKRKSANP